MNTLKLIDKAHNAAAKALNATTRQYRYAGFETGRKAAERANYWWAQFEARMEDLRKSVM